MIFELCCGSLEDSIIANDLNVDRIELNTALALGGLTPSMGLIKEVLNNVNIPVAVMIRPRAGGFDYNELEYKTMLNDLEELLNVDIEGIVFGFLEKDLNINLNRTEEFINKIHKGGKKAIFHRAFDNSYDKERSIKELIKFGCDRVLTSGGKQTAIDGWETIKLLQKEYGNNIDIVAGSGINEINLKEFIENTNITQVHSSCKTWFKDNTSNSFVDYDYSKDNKGEYDGASFEKVKKFKSILIN